MKTEYTPVSVELVELTANDVETIKLLKDIKG